MIDVTVWVDSNLGKELKNPWGTFQDECVSAVQDWIVANGWPMRTGNAIQWADEVGSGWAWTPNSPTAVPPAGAIVVFDVGTYGHVGIAMPGCTAKVIHLANQNWPKGNDTNPLIVTDFDYVHPVCKGWLTYGAPAPSAPAPAPTAPSYAVCTVKSGDTLSGIVANHYGLGGATLTAKISSVAKYNSIANANQIKVGQIIKLP